MSSNKKQNKERTYRGFNPKPDYTSENCSHIIDHTCKIKVKLYGVNKARCNQTHYNNCPILKGQGTLI